MPIYFSLNSKAGLSLINKTTRDKARVEVFGGRVRMKLVQRLMLLGISRKWYDASRNISKT